MYASPTTVMAEERGDLVPLAAGWSHIELGAGEVLVDLGLRDLGVVDVAAAHCPAVRPLHTSIAGVSRVSPVSCAAQVRVSQR